MPLTFLNGGSPGYVGYQFTTTAQLLSAIESTLNSAGWNTVSSSTSEVFMQGVSIAGGYSCYVDFVISGTSPNLTLTMRGWLESGKTNGSPDNVHTLTYTVGSTNNIWLTANQESGCIALYNATGAMSGYHFGFLQRVDINDQFAWMIGSINSMGYSSAYVAKSKINDTVWRQLSADYANYGTWGSYQNANPINTFDALARFFYETYQGGYYLVNDPAVQNPSYQADQGRLNYENSAIIDPYFYIEGRGSSSAYGNSTNGNILYFRGLVQNAYCGLAAFPAANQAVDSNTGYRILSVGGVRYQGMRIA